MEGLKPAAAPWQVDRSPPWLSLSFFFTAFAGLIGANALLLANADKVLTHYLLPQGVAVTHLAVLGWLSMAVMGAMYQLAPVLVQAPLASVKLAAVQFAVYVLGVGGLVESFARGENDSLPVHGAFAVTGVLLFLVNMLLTLRRIREWTVPARYLCVSLTLFTLTVSLGFSFAFARAYGWFVVEIDLLATHAHAGVAGWLGLTLIGVSYRLFPMFALVRGHDERLANAVLAILGVSLAGLLVSFAFEPGRWRLLPAAGVAAGFLLYAVDLARMYRHRLRRRPDLYYAHVALSTLALMGAVLAGVLAAAGWPERWTGEPGWMLLYAYLALGGWLTLAVMGHAYKIVPMLTWQMRYRHRAGAAPLLTEMYWPRLAFAGLGLYAAGFAVAAAGIGADSSDALKLGAALSLAGAAAFTLNMVRVLAGQVGRAEREGAAAPAAGGGGS